MNNSYFYLSELSYSSYLHFIYTDAFESEIPHPGVDENSCPILKYTIRDPPERISSMHKVPP